MSFKKQYLKNNGVCKVTFSLKNRVENIGNVRIAGDFNDWDVNCEPMKKLKSGNFSQTLRLDSGKLYQFKYLINDTIWENEPEADQFVPNGIAHGDVNSVIEL
ncbi:isoamylase early set domain-containing protein [Sunxiuqinia sp. sy24]|uniref:isoamylase early set domain-containing protein n=1 Tax=Sunxiuqinia sp. sy24 TaxID=3461495 RepID=UPI004046453E